MADKGEDHSKMLSNRLGQAIEINDLKHVRMYIEQGADLNRPWFSERYPLARACYLGHEEIMKELLNAGADPNQVTQYCVSQSAMFMAAEQHTLTLSMMSCLISHGADVNFRDGCGKTVLHILASRRNEYDTDDNILSVAKIVLENGASFYARDIYDYTPLYLACKYGNIDLVKLFIAQGADVNFHLGDMTTLRGAAECCKIDMFDMLLNAGANRHLTPDDLFLPCFKNDHAMMTKILDTCDVDINANMNSSGLSWRVNVTVLHNACSIGFINSEIVQLLLDRGADVRAVFDSGNTVLHYAVYDCKKIRHLLSYNPPLNIKNNENQTPLAMLIHFLVLDYSNSDYAAVYQNDLLAYKMLVTAGANVTADVEHTLNQFRIKHPEAQLPDYEIRSTRSLKEMCRFVIRETIPVPVDVSLCKLPIPKLLQKYLNFPECDQLVDKYLDVFAGPVKNTTTTTATISTTTASTSTTSTSTISTTTATNDDYDD